MLGLREILRSFSSLKIQMIELSTHVAARGGTPEDPLVYKKRYLDLLWVKIRDRVEGLRSGQVAP